MLVCGRNGMCMFSVYVCGQILAILYVSGDVPNGRYFCLHLCNPENDFAGLNCYNQMRFILVMEGPPAKALSCSASVLLSWSVDPPKRKAENYLQQVAIVSSGNLFVVVFTKYF